MQDNKHLTLTIDTTRKQDLQIPTSDQPMMILVKHKRSERYWHDVVNNWFSGRITAYQHRISGKSPEKVTLGELVDVNDTELIFHVPKGLYRFEPHTSNEYHLFIDIDRKDEIREGYNLFTSVIW